ncbi:MAG: putative toxin-antitoxin system toxin component, PIN family [Chloroflexota bacterium]
MLRAVLDTNVIISSILYKKGVPSQLMKAWYNGKFELVTSRKIIEEVVRVISEPRLKDTFRIRDERIRRLEKALKRDAVLAIRNADTSGAIPEDPSDEMFLSAAVIKKAAIIVSGDKHLLNLKEYRGIPILTPRQFLELLGSESQA